MQIEYNFKMTDYLFPYEIIGKGERIAIYGAGNVCRLYLSQLLTNHYCEVVRIYDSYKSDISVCGFRVESIEDFNAKENLRVVVAVNDGSMAEEIIAALVEKGLDRDQIVWKINKRASFFIEGKKEICKRIWCDANEIDQCFGKGYFDYFCWIRKNLRVFSPECGYIRVGAANDGGYVMANYFKTDGIAYSYGISDDVSWDDNVADLGYEVYMYDHTIIDLPHNRKEFHFFRNGIADSCNHDKDVDTLENHLLINGHDSKNGMVLKMDVEGAEYGFMDMVKETTIMRFDQIVFELHSLNMYKNQERVKRFIEKMNQTHIPVHVHANNWGDAVIINGTVFPDVIEITYLKKGLVQVRDSSIVLPGALDEPNCKHLPELCLGRWNDDITSGVSI